MPYFKSQSQYWALFVCIVVVAVLSRLQSSPGQPRFEPQTSSSQTVRQEALKGTVSGAIGIDSNRGDSVYVVCK